MVLRKQAVRAGLDLSGSEKVTVGTSCELNDDYVDSIISEEFQCGSISFSKRTLLPTVITH